MPPLVGAAVSLAARLYLVIPANTRPDDLAAALEAGDVACTLLLSAGLDAAALTARIEALRPPAQARDVAFLLQDETEMAAETGCDGVHLSDPEAYGRARGRLGDRAIVGVGCGASRHAAMVAAERGADYVGFGAPEPDVTQADPELLAWWQALMTVPCVAFGAAGPEDCAALATAGADFVAPSAAVWAVPAAGATAALRACREALAAAAETA